MKGSGVIGTSHLTQPFSYLTPYLTSHLILSTNPRSNPTTTTTTLTHSLFQKDERKLAPFQPKRGQPTFHFRTLARPRHHRSAEVLGPDCDWKGGGGGEKGRARSVWILLKQGHPIFFLFLFGVTISCLSPKNESGG